MQNEFEKQVQRKMEELNFVPSPPVWQNIEKQIRKDKEKRRAFFWIPVVALLLVGGGIWFQATQDNLTAKQENPGATSASDNTSKDNNQAPVGTAKSSQTTEDFNSLPVSPNPGGLTNHSEWKDADRKGTGTRSSDLIQPENPKQSYINSENNNNKEAGKTNLVENSAPPVKNHEQNAEQGEKAIADTDKTNAGNTDKTNSGEISAPAKHPATENKLGLTQATMQPDSINKKDSVIKDVVSIGISDNKTSMQPPSSSRKWILGIAASIGISGEGNGIRLSNEKSLDQLSSGGTSSPPLNNFAPGSPIQNSFSFGIGMAVKKEIVANLSFVSGANLKYYSSSRKVGKRMQDSTLPAGFTFTEFYLNSGQAENNVRSEYYFISVPLMLEWKFIPSRAFLVQGGISVQQLIASKAFQYDQQNGIYYKNAGDIHKTQVFANLMMGYEFKLNNKRTLTLGPSLQYGLSKMTEVENKHLFFAGIHAGYFFR